MEGEEEEFKIYLQLAYDNVSSTKQLFSQWVLSENVNVLSVIASYSHWKKELKRE